MPILRNQNVNKKPMGFSDEGSRHPAGDGRQVLCGGVPEVQWSKGRHASQVLVRWGREGQSETVSQDRRGPAARRRFWKLHDGKEPGDGLRNARR